MPKRRNDKKDCNHLWKVVQCEHVPSDDFELDFEDHELFYYIVEEITYECKHCQEEKTVLHSRII